MIKYYYSAPGYGLIDDGFNTRNAATKAARQWERSNGYGKGTATVHKYEG